MTTTRPYRKALEVREALRRLEDAAGTQLDEELVVAFVDGIENVAGHHSRERTPRGSGRRTPASPDEPTDATHPMPLRIAASRACRRCRSGPRTRPRGRSRADGPRENERVVGDAFALLGHARVSASRIAFVATNTGDSSGSSEIGCIKLAVPPQFSVSTASIDAKPDRQDAGQPRRPRARSGYTLVTLAAKKDD